MHLSAWRRNRAGDHIPTINLELSEEEVGSSRRDRDNAQQRMAPCITLNLPHRRHRAHQGTVPYTFAFVPCATAQKSSAVRVTASNVGGPLADCWGTLGEFIRERRNLYLTTAPQ